MPLHFGSILREVQVVRSRVGMFDVSHMGRIRLTGQGAQLFADSLLSGNIARLAVGRAMYCLLCTDRGGILDDVVVLRVASDDILLVCNASNRSAVWAWLTTHGTGGLDPVQSDQTLLTGMLAVQGPRSAQVLTEAGLPGVAELKAFHCTTSTWRGVRAVVARTGYTGEDGFEVVLLGQVVGELWQQLLARGVQPCGLGARDVLRLEAGLLLHGADMDSTVTPFEAGLARFVDLGKDDFVGKRALQLASAEPGRRHLVAYRMLESAVPRAGYTLLAEGRVIGHVTSGTYSPTLGFAIGLGYVSEDSVVPGSRLHVDVRGRPAPAEVVALPFYSRKGPAPCPTVP